ncbi:cyclophilin-like fold protein [uncultured Mailhella sp.]|uniref:cyclophilin-like fold protein n=1 Tax=uncultured Mailhella sp. TaxID=1981031 RepID=UPI0025F10FBD|nr:cyclophilin-like fold protein [uncultured Mailhella sp.]
MYGIITTLLGALLTLVLVSPGLCAPASGKSLIIVYSLTGNTRHVAEVLQSLTGADMEEIQTVTPYPDDFHAVVEQARAERNSGHLPPIRPLKADLRDYDTIYLGFPIWGNTVPQPMATFLAGHDLAGKTILPFCTHDGYGPGRSARAVAEYCPKARVLHIFDMQGSEVRNAKPGLVSWLKDLGVTPGQQSRELVIRAGETVLHGTLNDSPAARAFLERLPLSVRMTNYGGREYYGGLDEVLETREEGRLRFDDGDITYCPQNNTVAIFYAQTSRPDLTMKVIPLGKITSSLAPLHDMLRSLAVTFSLKD